MVRDRLHPGRHRGAQRRLYDAWVTACPSAVPLRARDPEYRAAYVAWLAEAETTGAFDAEARALDARLSAAVRTRRLAWWIAGRTSDEVDDLVEIQAPEGSRSDWPYVPLDWARRWPSEEVWKATRRG